MGLLMLTRHLCSAGSTLVSSYYSNTEPPAGRMQPERLSLLYYAWPLNNGFHTYTGTAASALVVQPCVNAERRLNSIINLWPCTLGALFYTTVWCCRVTLVASTLQGPVRHESIQEVHEKNFPENILGSWEIKFSFFLLLRCDLKETSNCYTWSHCESQ